MFVSMGVVCLCVLVVRVCLCVRGLVTARCSHLRATHTRPLRDLNIKRLRGMPPTLLGLRSQLDFDSFQNAINALCIDYSFIFSFEGRSRFEAEQGWRHVAKPFNVEVAKRPNMISTH